MEELNYTLGTLLFSLKKQFKYIGIYNLIARFYDQGFGKNCQDTYPIILNEIDANDIPFKNLLDIGCGTGALIDYLSGKTKVQKLYGIDPSQKMIEVANSKLLLNCQFWVAEAEKLPFLDNSIDFVVSTTAFSHWYDVEIALKEIFRVLKNSGSCIIIDHKKPNIFIKALLAMIGLLANYRGSEEIKSIFLKTNFKIMRLTETKKYFVAYIVPNNNLIS